MKLTLEDLLPLATCFSRYHHCHTLSHVFFFLLPNTAWGQCLSLDKSKRLIFKTSISFSFGRLLQHPNLLNLSCTKLNFVVWPNIWGIIIRILLWKMSLFKIQSCFLSGPISQHICFMPRASHSLYVFTHTSNKKWNYLMSTHSWSSIPSVVFF